VSIRFEILSPVADPANLALRRRRMADKSKRDDGRSRLMWRNLLLTGLATVLGLASFYAILGVMLANLHPAQPGLAEGERSPEERIRQVRMEDERKLTTYELIDPEKGIWRIPIDVAIEKMIAERPPRPPTK
jgi:hypothetical protein